MVLMNFIFILLSSITSQFLSFLDGFRLPFLLVRDSKSDLLNSRHQNAVGRCVHVRLTKRVCFFVTGNHLILERAPA